MGFGVRGLCRTHRCGSAHARVLPGHRRRCAADARVTGSAVIILAAVLHAVRPVLGTGSLTGLVLLKAALFVGFVVWGAARVEATPDPGVKLFDLGAFAVTLVWVSFSFSGWNGAVYLASEIRDPDRNLRRALWMPTLAVGALYLAANAVFVYAGPTAALAGRADIGAAAAGLLGGPAAERAVAAIISLALLTSVSVMVLSGRGFWPRWRETACSPAVLARGRGAPTVAIAFQAVLAVGAVLLSDLARLIGTLGFTLGLSAAITVAAAVWLRVREGPERVPIPGHPIVPAVFIGFTLWSSAFLVLRAPQEALTGTVLLRSGFPRTSCGACGRREGDGAAAQDSGNFPRLTPRLRREASEAGSAT